MRAALERDLPRRLRSKLDADDLVQEARLVEWQNFAAFQGRLVAEYRGWLVEICQGCLRRGLRRYRLALRAVTREEPLEDGAVECGRQRPHRRRETFECVSNSDGEFNDELETMLLGLPDRTRQILVEHACHGRTFCNLAAELGCSSRTVRRVWRQACSDLRRRSHD